MEWTLGAGVSPCRPARSGLDLCAARLSGALHISRWLSFVGKLSYLFRYKSSELARIEMDFSLTPKTEELRNRVSTFMDQYVFPIEKKVQRAMGESVNQNPQSLKDVRKKPKPQASFNLLLPN